MQGTGTQRDGKSFLLTIKVLRILHLTGRRFPYTLSFWSSKLRSNPGGSGVKKPPADAEDTGSIPGLGRSLGGGHSNPLQYSCLENPTDRGSWWATVQGLTKSQTQLSN